MKIKITSIFIRMAGIPHPRYLLACVKSSFNIIDLITIKLYNYAIGGENMLTFYLSMLDTEEEKLTFTEIYEHLKFPCLHVAMKITKNQAMAEDALQNGFLSVIKHKDEIFNLPREKMKSRIVIIVKNKAIDLLRADNKYATKAMDEMPEDVLKDTFDISTYVENQESFERLIYFISTLPEIYKTTFELRYVHGMQNPEIAELLNITPKTASMRIARAKLILQEMLKKEGESTGR